MADALIARDDAVETMRQRRNWLTERIKAKETIGWDVVWDTRERDALTWALDYFTDVDVITYTPGEVLADGTVVDDEGNGAPEVEAAKLRIARELWGGVDG